ncbi:MAG TPA: type IV pilin protein [Casimicrobiaceae bacterium]|nr:type IV pilin protein [Casimicrobiaceae bacterium]
MFVKRKRGFTLLEVMMVVAIVGVLAAIALPSYNNYVMRTNRSQAKQALQDIANREEQYRIDQRAYASTLAALGYQVSTDVAPYYDFSTITLVAVGATGTDCTGTANALQGPAYSLQATAQGSQLSDGNLCLDSNGNKTPSAKWSN